jgi:hypothetical protein
MLVKDKWCPGYSEDVWNIPDIGRHLFSVQSAAKYGIRVVKRHRWVMFQHDSQLMATSGWITDTYVINICVAVPSEPAKLTLQRLKKPFSFGMNVLAITTSVMCERCWKG